MQLQTPLRQHGLNPVHDLRERQGLRATQVISLADGLRFTKRSCESGRNCLDGHRLESCAGIAEQRHNRREADDPREQVDELILGSVDERGPENRELQSALSNQLFGGPFGLVITRGRFGPAAQRAHVDKSPDACLLRRGHQVPRAAHMHVLEGAVAKLANNPDQMDHRLHARQGSLQRSRLQHITGIRLHSPA